MFQPFVQGPRAPDRPSGGLGLGLSVVKGLVELHSGSIVAESGGLGKGTRVQITLPRIFTKKTKHEVDKIVGPAIDHKRILIIEDNVDLAFSLRMILQRRGYQVAGASTGQEGLGLASDFAPEVVICDIGLPDLDGYEVCRRMRELLANKPYIIALTRYGQESDVRDAQTAGFNYHMRKPANIDLLLKLLGGLVSH